MAAPLSPSPRGDAPVDSEPLLSGGALGRPSLRGAARLLRQGGRRVMREPSLLVREAAAEQLEERQADWAYSRPVVALDLLWNIAFVLVSAVVFVLSREENPSVPLRFWIAGYAAQCIIHMVCVAIEFRMRHVQRGGSPMPADEERGSDGSSSSSDDDDGERGSHGRNCDCVSIVKHLGSANTMFSLIWWIIGFYWVSVGGQVLTHDAPQLYWLCIEFLAFDVFFVVFYVALACIIGIAVCCCLPCIIAILYAVSDQEGASEDDIRQLPKFTFRRSEEPEKQPVSVTGSSGGIMIECGTNQPTGKPLATEDAECCICLSAYDDGAELRELPCDHHFHCACIDKWLHINTTCPLCKYNVRNLTAAAAAAKEYIFSCENIEHSYPSLPVSAAGKYSSVLKLMSLGQ